MLAVPTHKFLSWAALWQSPWQHPGVAYLFGGLSSLLFVVLGYWRRSDAWLFAVLQAEILLDATFTGGLSSLPPEGFWATIAAIFFVILGDLRYFYLIERQVDGDETAAPNSRWRAFLCGLLWALGIPLLTGIGQLLAPRYLYGNRLYFVYEVALLAVLLGHFAYRRRRLLPHSVPYARRLLALQLTQYALWALADAVILFGQDFGWALRLFPNFLYYAVFAPFACLSKDEEIRT